MDDYESYRTEISLIYSERNSAEKTLLKECFKTTFNKKNTFRKEKLCKFDLKPITRNEKETRERTNRA